MWHCALVSCTLLQSVGLFGVCHVLVLSVIMCSFYYFLDTVLIMVYIQWLQLLLEFLCPLLFILTYTLKLSETRWFWFCNYAPAWMFLPLELLLNIGLNMLPSDPFMSYLDSLLWYCTGEFQALHLIVLAVFGAVDHLLQYIGPLFGNLVVENNSGVVSLTWWRTKFSLLLILLIH